MAKQILELTAVGAIAGADLLWLEQSGLPRKITMTEIATFTGGGGIADGTVTDATMRWSGSAWVENTVAKISSTGVIGALEFWGTNNNYNLIGAVDSGIFAGYNIDSNAGVVSNLLTGAISGVRYDNQGVARFYADGSQTAGTTADPVLVLDNNYQHELYGALNIFDSGRTDKGTFSHNGVDFQTVFTSTSAWDVSGAGQLQFTGGMDLVLRDAGGLAIYDSGDTDSAIFTHGGTNFDTTLANTTAWTVQGASYMDFLGGMDLRLRDAGRLYLFDAGDTDNVYHSHNGTNAVVIAANTANYELTAFSGNLALRDGMGLQILDSGDADSALFSHDGADFNEALTGTQDRTMTGATRSYIFGDNQSLALQLTSGPWVGVADHAIGLESTTEQDNIELHLGVNEGTNNLRTRLWLSDETSTTGIQWSASSGVPDFQLMAGATLRQEVNATATDFKSVATGIRVYDSTNTDYIGIRDSGAVSFISSSANPIQIDPIGYAAVIGGKSWRTYSVGNDKYLIMQHNDTDGILGTPAGDGTLILQREGVTEAQLRDSNAVDGVSGFETNDFDQTMRQVGFADMETNTKSAASVYTLSETDIHKKLRVTDVTGGVTFPNDTGMLQDSAGWIINTTTSNLTLTATSNNLEVYSGDGVANDTGNMTLAGKGWCTWTKMANDTKYELVGVGLS